VVLPVVVLLVFAVAIWRDPRQFRLGVYLLLVIWLALMAAFQRVTLGLAAWDDEASAYFVLGSFLLVLAVVVVLGGFLVLNGVAMYRRESHRLANLLSLFSGLAILAFATLGAVAVATDSEALILWCLAAALPVGYLGFGFVAFLLYAGLYLFCTRRLFRRPDAVVVLGAGLVNGRVPRLLASRLDRGREVYDHAVTAGAAPVLVTSGGQGADEPVAEAVAMRGYLADHGVDPAHVLAEDRSATTEENLANTKQLLADQGLADPRVAVVTNDFHAFRAALLMRRIKLRGHAIAAPTAGYYWPSAIIREYAAILWDHRVFNGCALAVTLTPLALLLLR
jgi:uncharacterized SAM-binding protein YcdF (DUF218 family)